MEALLTMDNSPGEPMASLSDYLAAERTLLAWIRTGLALMGFGFVVARFGLFLQQLEALAFHLPGCRGRIFSN
jgi:putative membrane protein